MEHGHAGGDGQREGLPGGVEGPECKDQGGARDPGVRPLLRHRPRARQQVPQWPGETACAAAAACGVLL